MAEALAEAGRAAHVANENLAGELPGAEHHELDARGREEPVPALVADFA